MFIICKTLICIAILVCSLRIGILISKKYVFRLEELDELKNTFKIIENKIKYTYQPLEEIFMDISEISSPSISIFYRNVAKQIKEKGAEKAWKEEIDKIDISLKREDKEVLKEFGNLLGKTNKEGQINQIRFVNTLLDRQIENAEKERNKNEIVYKKLGLILGIGIVIVLI